MWSSVFFPRTLWHMGPGGAGRNRGLNHRDGIKLQLTYKRNTICLDKWCFKAFCFICRQHKKDTVISIVSLQLFLNISCPEKFTSSDGNTFALPSNCAAAWISPRSIWYIPWGLTFSPMHRIRGTTLHDEHVLLLIFKKRIPNINTSHVHT